MKSRLLVGVVCTGLVLALLAGSCQRAPDGKIDLDNVEVRAGLADLVDQERWSRVLVTAGTVEGNFEGDVVISGVHYDGKRSDERFFHRFDASTTRQTIEVPFRPRPDWDKVVVSFRGRTSNRSVAVQPTLAFPSNVMVIGIGAVPAELVAEFTESSDVGVQTGVLGADEMPRTPFGYDMADVLVVYGDEILRADEEQLAAMNEWVRRGGVVVGVPTLNWPGRIGGTAAAMFGVDEDLRPLEDATLLGRGNAVEYSPGSGRALLLLSLAAGAAIDEDPIAERAWSRVVRHVEGGFKPLRAAKSLAFQRAAVSALLSQTGFRFPSRTEVAIFVGAYIVIVFFGVGLLLRKRRRFELLYAVALIVAAAASIGISVFGFLSGIKEVSVDEFAVVRLGPDGKTGRAVSYAAISSPSRLRFEDDVVGSEVLVTQPVGKYSQKAPEMGTFPAEAAPDELLPLDYRVTNQAIRATNLVCRPNATRFVQLEQDVSLEGGIRARILSKGAAQRSEVEVTNDSEVELELAFVHDGQVEQLGSIDPGVTRRLQPTRSKSVDDFEKDDRQLYSIEPSRASVIRAVRCGLYKNLGQSAYLVAERLDKSLTSADSFGPVRETWTFLVLELTGQESQ